MKDGGMGMGMENRGWRMKGWRMECCGTDDREQCLEGRGWRTKGHSHLVPIPRLLPSLCAPVSCPPPPPQAAPQPQHCTGTGCHHLNLRAAARSQKSHRSFPVNICGALSALAFPSPAAPRTTPNTHMGGSLQHPVLS